MKIHRFKDEDLRALAMIAIGLEVSHLEWKVMRIVCVEENYWEYEVRFFIDEEYHERNDYEAFNLNCGRDNEPETYQMCWIHSHRLDDVEIKPICSPLLVCSFFEQMCEAETSLMN